MTSTRLSICLACGLLAMVLSCAGLNWWSAFRTEQLARARADADRRFVEFGKLTLWLDGIPDDVRQKSVSVESASNIRRADYAGPDACRKCHKEQYESWSRHSHRWMNALIENSPVKGKFDGSEISYLGGTVRFAREGDRYVMRLDRGEVHREYSVTQTIGSRFFQYYVGRQESGPEARHHPLYHEDHVLPLGYWIDRAEWVPIVHVHSESRDDQREDERHDPFEPRDDPPVRNFQDYADYSGRTHDLYRSACNYCHTTFAIGDMFVRNQRLLSRHVPVEVDVSLPEFLQAAHPEFWPSDREGEPSDDEFAYMLTTFRNFDAASHAVTLGVSCEACHLGAREHAEGRLAKPRFFPQAPELAIRTTGGKLDAGRTHDNVNWACGRCHAGERPYFAAGMATWNSTECTDALKGACYSQLTCIRCHNPHETLGSGWSRTAAEDDAVCLSCHQQLNPEAARTAHTHHSLDSDGSRCMNCHMPRLNEGLQEVVRTHTIFSPTNAAMIKATQPNACNMCHAEKSIEWTLAALEKWYGQTYSDVARASRPEHERPAAVVWLHSEKESVRLVAADCLTRARAEWALDDLIGALDDPYLLNRQFARIGLERMLDAKLNDFGYRFYMTPAERREPIEKLRQRFVRAEGADEKPGVQDAPATPAATPTGEQSR